MKKFFPGIIGFTVIFCLLLAGCASSPAVTGTASFSTVGAGASACVQPEKKTRIFTDSAGRKITVPVSVKSAAPSGPMAQIVLYTVAPDKLAGLAGDFSADAKRYIDKKYWSLPKFGQFYGKNASLNMEALVNAVPDVIVDIGERKTTTKEDMDGLQKQLGIPTVFISATLDTMEKTYTMLGDLLGENKRASQLENYCTKAICRADAIAKTIPPGERLRVYMAIGDTGLSTNAAGSIHADVLERVGAVNAANVRTVGAGGGSRVSLEQVIQWNPDVILADSDSSFRTVTSSSTWRSIKAVKNGKVYRIPSAPYSFISNPPSVNRIIGIYWLGNLLYPEKYSVDIEKEVRNFYRLFYSINLTDTQYHALVG
ncbi:MAG TPA: ABC transporter substrate-binding protein [Caproiciproducens sp.]|nr:ABC transporter substrate-binding protein [Caproiciproducens sp.]